VPPPDPEFLKRAWSVIAEATARANITVILGTERFVDGALVATALHEKAALCRAAENTCYFATVNYASPGSPTTSAIVRPDGTLLGYQPYGVEGLLIADIDTTTATGLFAARYKTIL